ncbi:hypothetical protein V8E53_007985 [Lactarius tabidus]
MYAVRRLCKNSATHLRTGLLPWLPRSRHHGKNGDRAGSMLTGRGGAHHGQRFGERIFCTNSGWRGVKLSQCKTHRGGALQRTQLISWQIPWAVCLLRLSALRQVPLQPHYNNFDTDRIQDRHYHARLSSKVDLIQYFSFTLSEIIAALQTGTDAAGRVSDVRLKLRKGSDSWFLECTNKPRVNIRGTKLFSWTPLQQTRNTSCAQRRTHWPSLLQFITRKKHPKLRPGKRWKCDSRNGMRRARRLGTSHACHDYTLAVGARLRRLEAIVWCEMDYHQSAALVLISEGALPNYPRYLKAVTTPRLAKHKGQTRVGISTGLNEGERLPTPTSWLGTQKRERSPRFQGRSTSTSTAICASVLASGIFPVANFSLYHCFQWDGRLAERVPEEVPGSGFGSIELTREAFTDEDREVGANANQDKNRVAIDNGNSRKNRNIGEWGWRCQTESQSGEGSIVGTLESWLGILPYRENVPNNPCLMVGVMHVMFSCHARVSVRLECMETVETLCTVGVTGNGVVEATVCVAPRGKTRHRTRRRPREHGASSGSTRQGPLFSTKDSQRPRASWRQSGARERAAQQTGIGPTRLGKRLDLVLAVPGITESVRRYEIGPSNNPNGTTLKCRLEYAGDESQPGSKDSRCPGLTWRLVVDYRRRRSSHASSPGQGSHRELRKEGKEMGIHHEKRRLRGCSGI